MTNRASSLFAMRLVVTCLATISLGLLGCGSGGTDTTGTASPAKQAERLCPRPNYSSDNFDASTLDGMRLSAAIELASSYECEVRVIERDGEHLFQTADIRPDRVDVAVRDGRIIGVGADAK